MKNCLNCRHHKATMCANPESPANGYEMTADEVCSSHEPAAVNDDDAIAAAA